MEHCTQSLISKENAGKASVGVAALPGARACKHWQERREQRSAGLSSRVAILGISHPAKLVK